jgi:hypothetical protein
MLKKMKNTNNSLITNISHVKNKNIFDTKSIDFLKRKSKISFCCYIIMNNILSLRV